MTINNITMPDPSARTSSGHKIIDGVQFHSYRVGICRYASMTEDGRIKVMRNYEKSTYGASTDGKLILGSGGKPKRFRDQETAMRAAVAALTN